MTSKTEKSGFVKLIVVIALALLIGIGGATIQHNQRYGDLKETFTVFCKHEGIAFQPTDKKLDQRIEIFQKSKDEVEDAGNRDVVHPYAIPYEVEVPNASTGRETRFSFRLVLNQDVVLRDDGKKDDGQLEVISVSPVEEELKDQFEFKWQRLTKKDLEINNRAHQGFLIIGKLKEGQKPGNLEATFKVNTNRGKVTVGSQFYVESAYKLRLVKGISYRPRTNTFLFGLVGKTQEKEGVVGLAIRVPTKDLKVELIDDGITPADCGLQVKIGKVVNNRNGSLANIHLTIPKDLKTKSYLSSNPKDLVKVRLKTNVPAVKEVEFFVSFAKQ